MLDGDWWGVVQDGDDNLFVFQSREKAVAFIVEWPGRRNRLFKVRIETEEDYEGNAELRQMLAEHTGITMTDHSGRPGGSEAARRSRLPNH